MFYRNLLQQFGKFGIIGNRCVRCFGIFDSSCFYDIARTKMVFDELDSESTLGLFSNDLRVEKIPQPHKDGTARYGNDHTV